MGSLFSALSPVQEQLSAGPWFANENSKRSADREIYEWKFHMSLPRKLLNHNKQSDPQLKFLFNSINQALKLLS